MAKYSFSNKAVEDLSNIWDYTFNVWSETQADKYFELIIETCKKISGNSDIGKNYSHISNEIFGFHVGKHIIFYRILTPKEIEVLRILHSRMDLKIRISE